ncbi:hypothetical protein [Candidatus Poriferisocius sp.]|uniref:hypothetical protein n=1 Tax=Candidatus Poriferisocius sp. TaxID=3101276 RepID=UPI003B01C412
MTVLADVVAVADRFARSASLERDASLAEPLEGYVLTARALDVVQRIASAAESGSAGGAWSLTGPYGSGKSSLGLLLDAAFGPAGDTRDIALGMLGAAPDAAELMRQAHSAHQTEQRGFHRGLVTAGREPLAHTVLRALHTAVVRSFGTIPPADSFAAAGVLEQALDDAEASARDPRRTGPSPAGLLEIARCVADDGPLLLLIDEFGKNLEAVADGASPASADPYLLQQLAEAGQGQGLPIFLVTLQHQSFDDYLSGVDATRRREWAKVQGRFEDIAYVESPAQTRALIGSVFAVGDDKLRARIQRWARPQGQAMHQLGVADLSDPSAVASCWPLHPVTAVVLSELCRRYGQHERTLFSFLAGQEMAGQDGFLSTAVLPERGPVPVLGLDAVYDYFVGTGSLSSVTAASNSRWIEIATRLRDAHGLSPQQMRIAKAVAMLNLVSTSGAIRASEHMIELAEPGSTAALGELEDAGLVTYRSFADEYRIWQGTDVDIRLLLEEARKQVQQQGDFEVVASMPDLHPAVAARHSAQHDCLRVFRRRFASCNDKAEPLDAFSPYDGQVLLVVDGDVPPAMAGVPVGGAKPTAAAIASPEHRDKIGASARELVALQKVLQDPSVKSDWVARHEMSERLAAAHAAFERAVFAAYASSTCRWVLLDGDRHMELAAGRGSSVLSDAADWAYPDTPSVPNEMLNRTHLTSQGAKARRVLIEAMTEHAAESQLGLEGNGPEVAMYKAVLAHPRLHVRDKESGHMVFGPPKGPGAAAKLRPAWKALEAEFERAKKRRVSLSDIYAALQSPPLGMKAGVVPVFVTAALLACEDVIAIYEHGTFRPQLTADTAERMAKNPGFYEIKHFASTKGARSQVMSALAGQMGIHESPGSPRRPALRVGNVLGVVGNLVARVRRLDNFTQQTRTLAPEVLAVRDAVQRAVEPDELVFASLPEALDFPQVPSGTADYPKAEEFAAQVASAMEALEAAESRLMSDSLSLLVASSGGASRQSVVERAGAADADVLDPAVRPFILALANTGTDDDLAWMRTVATVVAQKSPAEWADEDARRFRRVLAGHMAAFERLLALYSDLAVIGRAPRAGTDEDSAATGQAGGSEGAACALRVTVTRPDGREHARLVDLDTAHSGGLPAVLDEAIAKAQKAAGSKEQAEHLLLALLGDRVLGETADE